MLTDELYKWSVKGLLLECLNKAKSVKLMAKVHERICKSHKLGPKMRWMIHKHGYYWLTMVANCINYAKRCATCQRHDLV